MKFGVYKTALGLWNYILAFFPNTIEIENQKNTYFANQTHAILLPDFWDKKFTIKYFLYFYFGRLLSIAQFSHLFLKA